MKIMRILGSPLYQWEVGRQLEILPTPGVHVSFVHFSHFGDSESLVVEPRIENERIVVDIPNIMLQSGSNIVAYSVCVSAECVETLCDCVLPVCPRPKPSDYVYTETEVLTWESLDERLKKVEEGGVSAEDVADAVAAYMAENPVEIPTKVSAFENDAGYLTDHQDLSKYAKTSDIPKKLPSPYALHITGAVEATYDGSKAVEVVIPAAVTDEHINQLINTALAAIPNAAEVAY